MASIITATTTSGLTQSADNSGVLQLASGVGNLVTVPAVTGTAMVSGNMPAFSAYQSSAQALTANTWTKINFQTEEWDTNNNFASSRFTPTVAGYYQITGAYSCSTDRTYQVIAIYKNASPYKLSQAGNGTTGIGASMSALVYFNGSSDYVEIYGLSGTSQNVNASLSDSYFQGVLVRSA
jgi:hypothetical protein